ncbi:hypothetical protein ESCO_001622 [Escovopsis weberi]|uniref:5-methylcytosine G/T mismatch-specific DNA glycosylase n=1 Tax=Escovopsis weberi TaxID=150374 RepID=A0A0M8N7N1_ESCWE|nr:hypothetical protein ESCO_001622 [Escovopsis weberi]
MPSEKHEVDVDVNGRLVREKQRRTKSERKSDRDRPHRSSRSLRGSRIGDGSDILASLVSSSTTKKHRATKRDSSDKEKRASITATTTTTTTTTAATATAANTTTATTKDREADRDRERHDERRARSASLSSLPLDDFSRMSLDKDRIPLPYPAAALNKAHSKENIGSRDDGSAPPSTSTRQQQHQSHPLTPEPTDLGDEGNINISSNHKDDDGGGGGGSSSNHNNGHSLHHQHLRPDDIPRRLASSKKAARPPTPPETDLAAEKKRQLEGHIRSSKHVSRSTSLADDRSKVSRRSSSSQATFFRSSSNKVHDRIRSSVLRSSSMSASRHHSTKRSASTRSVKKPSSKPEPIEVDSSPSSIQDNSPKTPTQAPQFPSHLYSKRTRSPTSAPDPESNSKTATPAPPSHPPPPIPAPPPPPAIDVHEAPRVDYLLQNGGLPQPVPRNFLSVLPPPPPSSSGGGGGATRPSNPPLTGVDTLFTPFSHLLDQYQTVFTKQGSIAVATGHRSIARRLLDRLENVFSRDLPTHGCSCIICEKSGEVHRGLNWGDVLEWVSGRIELPQWPPFDLAEIGTKAAEISGETPRRPDSPVQLDPDIAEEFREHYLRQSKKVRSAVDRWLSTTGETPVPPPQDVDDETLCFAIMTNLEPEDRPYFNALLSGSRELRPATRAPTPISRSRTDLLVKTGLSLQRLYRLPQVPRDAECAIYLIKNHRAHDLLVTLSNINNSEWEILTSGRFDGFLWSGADAEDLVPGGGISRGPSVMGSRATTPFSPYSRNATPASFISLASSGVTASRQPVSNDEEMEIMAIAEIERQIYSGMEALEDAFEKLHLKAEAVRTSLRQRSAGLMQNLQMRRRIDVLGAPGSSGSQSPGTERPAWAPGSDGGDPPSDNEWGLDDFELMPDDSASNISSSRHRRPKRRVERRTPAPIEEDDEER